MAAEGAKLSIAVMGTGGVGGYFGGRLAEAGENVSFIARGAHLKAIQTNGLKIVSPAGDALIRAKASDRPADIGPVDVVLFAVKLYDVESAAEAIRPLLGPKTTVVSLQNGIDAEERMARILGPERIMGGVAFIFANIDTPGVIRHNGAFARIVFGELDGRTTPRAEAVAATMARGQFTSKLTDKITWEIWNKFVYLASMAAVTCLSRSPYGPIMKDPEARRICGDAIGEAAQVAKAQGIDLGADVVERCLTQTDKLGDHVKTSMLNDLERGGRLEVEHLSGAIVRMGRQHNVATPIHRTAYAMLRLSAGGKTV